MTEPQDREVSAYEKLAAKAKEIFESAQERSSDALESALKRAREGMEKAGEIGREEGEKLVGYLRRDLKTAGENAERVGGELKERLDPGRVSSAFLGFASTLFTSAGGAFATWAAKAEDALVFRTGEITGPGTLTCKSCGAELHIQGTKRIPPCPKCATTEFRKSY